MEGYHLIAEEAARLVGWVPASVIKAVVLRLATCDGIEWAIVRGQIALAIPSPDYRGAVISLLDLWRSKAPEVSPQAITAALITASHIVKKRREEEAVEVVWTGPDQGVIPLRRTEQAILQVVNSAQWRILLVSYAVYSIPNIQDAVVRAAKRGVKITVIVETPNKLAVETAYSTIQALGEDVATCSTVYYWPRENRMSDLTGRLGILHVKCVVGDGKYLFLSSANLTKYAFSLNMELGLLISGGRPPRQIEAVFESLITQGTFTKVQAGDL
jgi:phosphatidylserine/phosphatidylglycerophosphate/cardiolipin synthase-like enzyme